MRIAVRGFTGRYKIFEERFETDGTDLDRLAQEQLKRMLPYPRHMIEIEFLDEPDVNQRFFRFGTDPQRMVRPMGIDLGKQ